MNTLQEQFLWKDTSIAPLVTLRVLFGFMMAYSIVRFAAYDWIDALYIQPKYYFTYYGFDWVKPWGEWGMYVLFALLFLSSIGIMLGCFYRLSIVVFFLLFTYVELIDKTNYLNHYYFVSIFSFLMIWVPAHRCFSIDAWRRPGLGVGRIPAWTINIFKAQLGMVYFFAGLAKLNFDWLFLAMPLKIWLPAESHLPLIGPLLEMECVAYVFSWSGAIYDLTIVFFLLYRPTRGLAYLAVVVFHVMTAYLFQIGMFPWIMIALTTIFFSSTVHESVIRRIKAFFGNPMAEWPSEKASIRASRGLGLFLSVYFVIQLFLPFRYLMYPGSLYWTEQGYRFSWRVMLMEKAGYATFTVTDGVDKRKEWVDNNDYLTRQQEKMMSTQPDMILQYAHFLAEEYRNKGFQDPQVYCNSKVMLNARPSQAYIDPSVDLAKIERGFHHKDWILPQQ
ncbi:MAG: HTTM domain-containing protein [Bacteroidota bacterium]